MNCSVKLAAENKINAKNSWSLKLIDHLSELVRPEKPEANDGNTNFQKASTTLDAGVVIYSKRVDSVHSETFKFLCGLSRTASPEDVEVGGEADSPQDGTRHRA